MGAWGVSRSWQESGALEILKYPAGLDAIASVVIDASTVTPDSDGNRKLVAGTLLAKSGTKYHRYTSAASGEGVGGVLATDQMFASGNSQGDQPAPMFFHGCVFRSDRIVEYNNYGTAAKAALPTCRFE